MGEGHKEDLHWKTLDRGGKHPTNFSIILMEGFEIINNDGVDEVWLCRDVETASITLVIPYTTAYLDLQIAARYTDAAGAPLGAVSTTLASWRTRNWLEQGQGDEKTFEAHNIDSADGSKAGFILWPERLKFWNGDEFMPRIEGNEDISAHRVEMKIERELADGDNDQEVAGGDEDRWLTVGWVRLHAEEEEQDPPEFSQSERFTQNFEKQRQQQQQQQQYI